MPSDITNSQLERLVPMMQEPFLALTHLELWPVDGTASALPDMLRSLTIGFESPASRPDRRGRRTPPLTRVILPALFKLRFRGVSEYLEDLVARIDAPRLNDLSISFFNQLVLDTPQLLQFITHIGVTKSYNRAEVVFTDIYVQFSHSQICNQYSLLLPSVEQLDIFERRWNDSNGTWLELFRPFTAVRTLRISRSPQSSIMRALQELSEDRTIEVLPSLDCLYLEDCQPSGPEQKAIEPFIAARQDSDHPVAVHFWEGQGWKG
ncbi:hypothetical protein BJV78DRAFT_1352932 [Lactifluus subvellereus]|nr:hypothetical protein BJV78DRAFT_1352932 [Lactifluus subvellereus]